MKINTQMRRFNIAYTILFVAIMVLSLYSCVTRTENLDNINVITKPYSVYFSDSNGLIFTTYDGERIVPHNASDDYPIEAINTSSKYVLMIKRNGLNVFIDDGGQGVNANFNPAYTFLNPAAFGPAMMINVPNYNDTGEIISDRVYVASSELKGVAFSDVDYNNDTAWRLDPSPNLPGSGVTSFAYLDDGRLIAFDDVTRTMYVKPDFATNWQPINTSGLPATGIGKMYIVKQKNDVLAIMLDGDASTNGIWRSSGANGSFSPLPTIPPPPGRTHVNLTCAEAPFGKVVIACSDSSGIFRLDGQGTWQPANIGLLEGASVNGIAYHNNKFKTTNDADKKVGEYIFIATTRGVYRSDDLGRSWIKLDVPTITDHFTAIH